MNSQRFANPCGQDVKKVHLCIMPKSHETRPLVLGLTGGMASGKSLVGRMLGALGVPVWDAGQSSWRQTPSVPSIVDALEQAYAMGKGKSDVAKAFAKDFDVETVWKRDWMPLLRKEFDVQA